MVPLGVDGETKIPGHSPERPQELQQLQVTSMMSKLYLGISHESQKTRPRDTA